MSTFRIDYGPQIEVAVGGLADRIEESSGGHGALAARSFVVFVLLYTPCAVAVGAIRHEVGTRWMRAIIIGMLLIAWLFAVAVFQGGLLLGLG